MKAKGRVCWCRRLRHSRRGVWVDLASLKLHGLGQWTSFTERDIPHLVSAGKHFGFLCFLGQSFCRKAPCYIALYRWLYRVVKKLGAMEFRYGFLLPIVMKNGAFVPFREMHSSLSVIDFFCNSDQKTTRQRLTPQERAFIVTQFAKTPCARQVRIAFSVALNAHSRRDSRQLISTSLC